MISQPMAGKTDEEIAKARDKAHAKLREMGYEFVNTLFTDEWYGDEAIKAGRTHADAASSMMSPSRTGLRCCMRISDDERREIANELRRQAAYSSGSLGEWWQRLQEIVTGEVDFANPQETYRAIADLIDRPSENIERPR